jgi:FMN reductase
MTRLKIVGLGGTPRAGSSTEMALRACLALAEADGAETVLITGHDLVLPIYIPELKDRAPEALQMIEHLRTCDGLIVASPGYHGSISGLIKNALDYVEDLRGDRRSYLEGRVVGCIIGAAGDQARGTALVALRSIVHALRGWPTPFGATLNTSSKLFDSNSRCIDAQAKQQIELMVKQVLHFTQMQRSADDTLIMDHSGAL